MIGKETVVYMVKTDLGSEMRWDLAWGNKRSSSTYVTCLVICGFPGLSPFKLITTPTNAKTQLKVANLILPEVGAWDASRQFFIFIFIFFFLWPILIGGGPVIENQLSIKKKKMIQENKGELKWMSRSLGPIGQ